MRWNSRFRCTLACFGFIALFSIFSFRLIYVQMIQHDFYLKIAVGKHGGMQPIYAERGSILDSNGEVLANNVPTRTVVADATLLNHPGATIRLVSQELKIPEEELTAKILPGKQYIVLQRDVALPLAMSLKAKLDQQKLRGIDFKHDSVRVYPNKSMLCHVIGFTNSEHCGVDGVEKSLDEYLRGEDGYRYIEHDRTGREIVQYRGEERSARNGYNVGLTIDLGIQNIVENEIDAAMREFRPKKATIILMRPQTGEILAMANRPNFDLNEKGTAKPEEMKNRAVIDEMEPGSTFKIVSVAAALEEQKVQPDSWIFCENGVFNYGGSKLHDHRPFGDLTVLDVLVKSSNIGAAKLAMKVGDEKFYEFMRRFGFGERTGIELPGEIPGSIKSPRNWTKTSITHMPMGHEVDVTALQMTTAMCVIANGGKLMMPRIVKSITTETNEVISAPAPVEVRRVISTKTAQQIGTALRGVVSDRGTAAVAAVPGFVIAGKTGTAEKIDPVTHHYERDHFVVSFVGYLPADHPEFVGLVVLDDAQTTPEKNYGGQVAGPIFSKIAEQVARYMNLRPEEKILRALPVEGVAANNVSHR